MKEQKSIADCSEILKETGSSIYAYLGKLLVERDEHKFEIERRKVYNDTARQAYNNGSLAMRACRYDYDVRKLDVYDVPRLEIERERLELERKKFELAEKMYNGRNREGHCCG